jgi:hypothetical protein
MAEAKTDVKDDRKPPANGAELVKALSLSGTRGWKLEVARKVLADTAKMERGRIASVEEIVLALESAEEMPPATIAKAKQIAATGKWEGAAAESKEVPIEDRLLAEPAEKGEKPPPGKK